MAQRTVYHVPGQRHSTQPFSAVARVSSERTLSLTPSPPKLPKSWRPSSSFMYCSKAIPPDSATQKDEKQTEAINTVQDVYKQRYVRLSVCDSPLHSKKNINMAIKHGENFCSKNNF